MTYTLKDFSDRLMRPTALRAIRSGSCDHCLADLLEYYADGEDKELKRALLDRAFLICATPPLPQATGKIGSVLRIKLPKDFKVVDLDRA